MSVAIWSEDRDDREMSPERPMKTKVVVVSIVRLFQAIYTA